MWANIYSCWICPPTGLNWISAEPQTLAFLDTVTTRWETKLPSQQERVPTQQTMLGPGTANNGISGGLQMCQLECEQRVRYANEQENPSARRARPIYSTAAGYGDVQLIRVDLQWFTPRHTLDFMADWFQPREWFQYLCHHLCDGNNCCFNQWQPRCCTSASLKHSKQIRVEYSSNFLTSRLNCFINTFSTRIHCSQHELRP